MANPTEPEPDPTLEQDDRFPSGPWEGYYLQAASLGRQGMELVLTFREGTLRGDGRDIIGDFLIRGTYETDTGKCWWTKHYIGSHDVAYQGYAEGHGIWGTWEIGAYYRGGFHIWPVGNASGEQQVVSEEVDRPRLVGVGVDSLGSETLGDTELPWD